MFLHNGVDPVQAIAGETSLLRSGCRQTRAARQRCDQTEDKQNPHEGESITKTRSTWHPGHDAAGCGTNGEKKSPSSAAFGR
jgi:hypothetical protein